jgi:hypothetical protein
MTDKIIKIPLNMKSASMMPVLIKYENNSLPLIVGPPAVPDRISDFYK